MHVLEIEACIQVYCEVRIGGNVAAVPVVRHNNQQSNSIESLWCEIEHLPHRQTLSLFCVTALARHRPLLSSPTGLTGAISRSGIRTNRDQGIKSESRRTKCNGNRYRRHHSQGES